MSADQSYSNCPSLEEILAAAEPGAPQDLRDAVRQRLQQYLPQDEALDGAIRFLQDHDYDFDALHEFLEAPFSGTRSHTRTVRLQPAKLLGMAAIVAGIVLASWYYITQFQPNRQLAAAAFYEPGLPVYAGIGQQKMFQEMMSAYRGGETEEGLRLYRQLATKQPLNDTLQYFGGWLYYQCQQPDSAAMLFQQVTALSSEAFGYKAEYMQAISLYLCGKRSQARLQLEQIAARPNHAFAISAQRMLQEISHW